MDLFDLPEEKLTEEQIKKLLEIWNENPNDPPSLQDLAEKIFEKKGLDGRSKEGRLIREYLAKNNLQAKKAYEYKVKGLINLSEEQKEFITNNHSTMKGVEMAKALFNIQNLTNLSQETRTVLEFVKSLDQTPYEEPQGEIWAPPRKLDNVIARINKYIESGIDFKKITPKEKKNLETLRANLQIYSFIHQINSFSKIVERELFESNFIRFTYNKSDLTQEEIEQYILLCIEKVRSARIQAREEIYHKLLDRMMEEMNEDEDKKIQINMGLVEAIKNAQTEYNQCMKRQEDLIESLNGTRADRLDKQIKENASILNLVLLWKFEETRKPIIMEGEKRKDKLREAIKELSAFDEMKAKVLGFSEEEMLN